MKYIHFQDKKYHELLKAERTRDQYNRTPDRAKYTLLIITRGSDTLSTNLRAVLWSRDTNLPIESR